MACVVVLAAIALAASPARADGALEEAARHFEEGTRLYGAGSYRSAIDEFEAANAIAPAGANLFNLARCYEKLAEFRVALEHYERYLEDASAPERELVERRIAELRALPVELFVSTAPAGARVLVDGRGEPEPERTPSVVRLRPGRHLVRVERDGYLSAERSVDLRSLASGRVHLDLVAVDADLGSEVGEGDALGVDPATVPSVLEEIRTRREHRTVLWRLSVALGASKYDDTGFVVGLDGGPLWRSLLFNLHWVAMTSDFTGQILGEAMWDVALDDLDLFVGLGAGATQVRTSGDSLVVIPWDSTAAFVGELVGGIDFFLRRPLALGMTLRLQFPIDGRARDRAGLTGEGPTLLILAAGHVALHL